MEHKDPNEKKKLDTKPVMNSCESDVAAQSETKNSCEFNVAAQSQVMMKLHGKWLQKELRKMKLTYELLEQDGINRQSVSDLYNGRNVRMITFMRVLSSVRNHLTEKQYKEFLQRLYRHLSAQEA